MPKPNKLQGREGEVVREHLEGKTMPFLADKYGVKIGSIQYTLTKHRAIRKVVNDVAGKRDQIVQDYQSGLSRRQISKKYKCSDATLKRFLAEDCLSMRPYTESNRIHTLDQTFFDCINTEAKAYFLGLLYADGCLHDAERNNSIALVLQMQDVALIEQFRSELGSSAPVIKTGLNNSQRRFAVYSERLFNRLCELGCSPRKSLTCTFPELLSDDMLPHFLRGYLDGDGWVIVNGSKIGLGMIGSIPFIEKAVELIGQKVGVTMYVRGHHKSKEVLQLQVNGGHQVRKLIAYLYDSATIYLRRKKVKADIIRTRSYYKIPSVG